jgi:hypothetical protein
MGKIFFLKLGFCFCIISRSNFVLQARMDGQIPTFSNSQSYIRVLCGKARCQQGLRIPFSRVKPFSGNVLMPTHGIPEFGKRMVVNRVVRLVLIQRKDLQSSHLCAGAMVLVQCSILIQAQSFAPLPFLLR